MKGSGDALHIERCLEYMGPYTFVQ